MQTYCLHSKESRVYWEDGYAVFVVCVVREAARSVHVNGTTYIWFYRRRSRTETIHRGSNLIPREVARNAPVVWNMFDVWDVLICM